MCETGRPYEKRILMADRSQKKKDRLGGRRVVEDEKGREGIEEGEEKKKNRRKRGQKVEGGTILIRKRTRT